jgi:hypothetical protein
MATGEEDLMQARERMVHAQLRGRDITDEHVPDAMNTVPRHCFVPADMQQLAYADGPVRLAFVGTDSRRSELLLVWLPAGWLEAPGTIQRWTVYPAICWGSAQPWSLQANRRPPERRPGSAAAAPSIRLFYDPSSKF